MELCAVQRSVSFQNMHNSDQAFFNYGEFLLNMRKQNMIHVQFIFFNNNNSNL